MSITTRTPSRAGHVRQRVLAGASFVVVAAVALTVRQAHAAGLWSALMDPASNLAGFGGRAREAAAANLATGLVALLLTSHVGVALHEFLHWRAASRRGLQPTRARIGEGPVLRQTSWGSTPVEIRLFPLSGQVQLPLDVVGGRDTAIVVFRAGARGNLGLAVALLALGAVLPAPSADVSWVAGVLQAFWWVGSVWPSAAQPGRPASDGWWVRALRRGDLLLPGLVQQATSLARSGDTTGLDALAGGLEGRLPVRDRWWLPYLRGWALLTAGRPREAVAAFDLALAAGPDAASAAAVGQARLDCLLTYHLADGEDLPEGEATCVAEALRDAPPSDALTHTWAMLRLLQDRPHEAVELLAALRVEDLEDSARAIVEATWVIAEARSGRATAARLRLRKVPDACPLARAAAQAVAAGDGPAGDHRVAGSPRAQ